MGYIALVTNTAIIIWTSKLFDSENISQTERALMFFVSCQVLVVIAGLIEGCIRGMPRQLDLLMRRFDTIVAIVFKGLTEGDDSHLNEVAEKLDLTIYPNNQWEDPNQIK
jgi:heme/copper-type cytochrome/quinol oxidase subunit 1